MHFHFHFRFLLIFTTITFFLISSTFTSATKHNNNNNNYKHNHHHSRRSPTSNLATPTNTPTNTLNNANTNHRGITRTQLDNWCTKFGQPLSEFIKTATKYNELHGRFASTTVLSSNTPTSPTTHPTTPPFSSKIHPVSPPELLTTLTSTLSSYMQEHLTALNKLRTYAEERALDYFTTSKSSADTLTTPPPYIDSRQLSSIYNFNGSINKIKLKEHGLKYSNHYQDYVNLHNSSVHLPTSVFSGDPEIVKTLTWTSGMDKMFKSISREHPVVGRMFFGGSDGVTKIYPATPWPIPPPPSPSDPDPPSNPPDLFDPRLRPWYTLASNSPKSVVILQDTSGSMTGRRREIAKHVVYTILDTLTPDDFVTVLNYSSSVKNIIECWGEKKLVNANSKNILKIKYALDRACADKDGPECTQGMADLEKGLNASFSILSRKNNNFNNSTSSTHTTTHPSANCNSAIFLITDGSPDYYKDIFESYKDPLNPVRVFTYLIGKEVTDYREIRWMSCATGGFFTHITTLSSVLPSVLNYLPVMSRPLVIYNHHPITITSPYINKLTQPHRSSLTKSENNGQEFNFVVTISSPVFDLRNHSGDQQYSSTRSIANYLGTVGIDINLNELYQLSDPFKLGVGGYAWILEGRSGRVILHPKWRPVTRGGEILKPGYSDVYWDEVEEIVVNVNSSSSNNNKDVIQETLPFLLTPSYNSYHPNIPTPFPSSNYRRLSVRPQDIEYTSSIPSIPQWTLGVSLPSHSHTLIGEVEMFRVSRDGRGTDVVNWLESSTGTRKWKLNPNWRYCSFIKSEKNFESQEDELVWFLREMQKKIGGNGRSGWPWKNTNVGIVRENNNNLEHSNESSNKGHSKKTRHQGQSNKSKKTTNSDPSGLNLEDEVFECSKPLVQSLLFDANITEIFTAEKLWKFNKNESAMIEMYGALLVFISTRSGLTRWIEFENTGKKTKHQKFYSPYKPQIYPQPPSFPSTLSPFGPDDEQYSRAVDHWHFIENVLKNTANNHNKLAPNSLLSGGFVFSVPLVENDDKIDYNDLRVTATRAIFIQDPVNPMKSAPAGIVGIQFNHTKLRKRWFDISGQCLDTHSTTPCTKTCASEEFDCYVLDDNGFILIGEDVGDTGKFFGLISGMVMEMLINSDVYKRIPVTDTQAVCKLSSTDDPKLGKANRLSIFNTFKNLLKTALLLIFSIPNALAEIYENFEGLISTSTPSPEIMSPIDYAVLNKENVRSCRVKYELVTFGAAYNPVEFSYHGILNKCGYNCDGYFNVHSIPHTNLILVVTDGRCRCGHNTTDVKGEEVDDFDEVIIRDEVMRCPKVNRDGKIRRKIGAEECFNYNVEEDKISPHACGRGNILVLSNMIISFTLINIVAMVIKFNA